MPCRKNFKSQCIHFTRVLVCELHRNCWGLKLCRKFPYFLIVLNRKPTKSSSSYRNVYKMSFISFSLSVIFIIRLFSTSTLRVPKWTKMRVLLNVSSVREYNLNAVKICDQSEKTSRNAVENDHFLLLHHVLHIIEHRAHVTVPKVIVFA